jgi:tryptophanyl-tRNA synthetase
VRLEKLSNDIPLHFPIYPAMRSPYTNTAQRLKRPISSILEHYPSIRHPECRRYNSSSSSKPQIIFSGIQPTGIPHLGNYLGALLQWVNLQNSSPPGTKLFYSIVDLHAITLPQKPGGLRRWKRESLATLLAVGLDPERSVLFYQSAVSFDP